MVRKRDEDALAGRAERLECPGDETVDGPELEDRLGGSGLEAGEVEQVRDEPVEPSRLEADRGEQLLPLVCRERLVGAGEHLSGRADRGQRGTEVVADRAEQPCLDGVAAAERLRLDRLAAAALLALAGTASELLTLDRSGE